MQCVRVNPMHIHACGSGIGLGHLKGLKDKGRIDLIFAAEVVEKRADADDKTQGIGDAELMDILDRDKVFSDWDFEVNKPSSSPMAIPNEGEMYDIIVTDDGKGGLMGGLS